MLIEAFRTADPALAAKAARRKAMEALAAVRIRDVERSTTPIPATVGRHGPARMIAMMVALGPTS
jgi:ABC-type dipeptide/oligopeptide/nickel transport system ATPase component